MLLIGKKAKPLKRDKRLKNINKRGFADMLRKGIYFAILFINCLYNIAIAFDNEMTHPDITENAINNSNLENYLIQNFGYAEGLKTKFPLNSGKTILYLLRKGSTDEDSDTPDSFSFLPQCRAVNHFHNPLLSWDQSYMTDQPWFVDVWCWDWKPIYSNITWATSYLSPPPDGAKVPFTYTSSSSPYTWDRARDYYYKALTLATAEDREIYLAWTFQTVGHVMHLLEDMAVPAHTRNDFQSHYIRNNNSFFDRIQPFEHYVKVNPSLVASANPTITDFPSFINTRLTDFWDTNLYNGSNPSTFNNIGLAEFTNANYFSDYTIPINNPTPKHTFPYPYISDTTYQVCPQEIAPGILQKYISRKINGQPCPSPTNAGSIDHFAAVGLLSGYPDPNTISYMWLDDNVHNTYAKELLPRAVGYSAGLLDYFFRGNIEITIPTIGIYAQTNDPNQGFTSIKLLAKNTTSTGEEMTDGSIELVVKYRLALEDPFQSNPVPTTNEFSYKVVPEFNNIRSIPRNTSVELTFDSGQNTIVPINATDVYLQLVYHGRLGYEDGAVAIGLKDISEPTPVDVFNNMDKICLYANWYNTGSPEAINQVDPNHDGIPDWDIYTHNINNAYLKISNINDPINASPSNYTFYTSLITFGTLYRAYVLSDYEYTFNYSDYMTGVTTTSEDIWTHANGGVITGNMAGSSIKNQVDYHVESQIECDTVGATAPCDIRYYPLFYPFRSINIWGPAGYIIDNPKYPTDTSCPWGLLP